MLPELDDARQKKGLGSDTRVSLEVSVLSEVIGRYSADGRLKTNFCHSRSYMHSGDNETRGNLMAVDLTHPSSLSSHAQLELMFAGLRLSSCMTIIIERRTFG